MAAHVRPGLVLLARVVALVVVVALVTGCARSDQGRVQRDMSRPATSTLELSTAPSAIATAQPHGLEGGSESPQAAPRPSRRHSVLLGVFAPPAPWDMSALDAFDRASKKDPAILMWYQAWEGPVSAWSRDAVDATFARGAVPLITWEPWRPGSDSKQLTKPSDQPDFSYDRILDGSHDAYIRSWARGVRDVGEPVMLRPMHEMNGNWYPWGGTVNGNEPRQFARVWRHIWRIFEDEGADNVLWVWAINGGSVPRTAENAYAVYYPGDEYVDWVGMSGFNWGASRDDLVWQDFDEIYDKPLAYLETLDKPIVICEMGSVESGGDKPAWITDAYTTIGANERIRAVVYYNARDVRPESVQDWRIDTSASSRRAYERAVADDRFEGAGSRDLLP